MADEGRGRARTTTWRPQGAAAGHAQPSLGVVSDRIQRVLEWLRATLAAEAAQTQLLPWIAVGFGTGVVLYFTAAREPLASVAAPLAALACGVAFLVRRTLILSCGRRHRRVVCGLRQRNAAHHHRQTTTYGAPLYSVAADRLC